MESFSTPFWIEQVQELSSDLDINNLDDEFLRHPIIQQTMFANDPNPDWRNEQLEYVICHFGKDRALDLLDEPEFGSPIQHDITAMGTTVRCSHNNVHHLYHIARWREALDRYDQPIRGRILEWGGGYGNMARLMHKVYPHQEQYWIADLPWMRRLQETYLRITDYEAYKKTFLFDARPSRGLSDVGMFISTWALSECTEMAQNYVEDHKFFGADTLLMAHQLSSSQFSEAENLEEMARRSGYSVRVENFHFTSRGDQYVFA